MLCIPLGAGHTVGDIRGPGSHGGHLERQIINK